MARSLNKVQIIGYIQPEAPVLKYTSSGKAVCSFKVVTDESYVDKNGTKHEKAEWHNITFWGKQGELIDQYMKKGSRIYIEGRLETQKWEDNQGVTHFTTKIIGSDVLFLDNKSESPTGKPAETAAVETGGEYNQDDDLPF